MEIIKKIVQIIISLKPGIILSGRPLIYIIKLILNSLRCHFGSLKFLKTKIINFKLLFNFFGTFIFFLFFCSAN